MILGYVQRDRFWSKTDFRKQAQGTRFRCLPCSGQICGVI